MSDSSLVTVRMRTTFGILSNFHMLRTELTTIIYYLYLGTYSSFLATPNRVNNGPLLFDDYIYEIW